ncbi:vesicle-associated membrane protein 724 [Artemisia annua]|uniref:Vesicle-associated membrane protein 724 n=1 Tax=Artemisia annua TaxID=35608 RepID=A0A2U1LX51_ARTAN|nr:vesicle-associated membrane protein 724 [Artemisia annua]
MGKDDEDGDEFESMKLKILSTKPTDDTKHAATSDSVQSCHPVTWLPAVSPDAHTIVILQHTRSRIKWSVGKHVEWNRKKTVQGNLELWSYHKPTQMFGYCYCVVAKQSVDKQISVAFLERVKADFKKQHNAPKAETTVTKSLNKEFGCKTHFKHVVFVHNPPNDTGKTRLKCKNYLKCRKNVSGEPEKACHQCKWSVTNVSGEPEKACHLSDNFDTNIKAHIQRQINPSGRKRPAAAILVNITYHVHLIADMTITYKCHAYTISPNIYHTFISGKSFFSRVKLVNYLLL